MESKDCLWSILLLFLCFSYLPLYMLQIFFLFCTLFCSLYFHFDLSFSSFQATKISNKKMFKEKPQRNIWAIQNCLLNLKRGSYTKSWWFCCTNEHELIWRILSLTEVVHMQKHEHPMWESAGFVFWCCCFVLFLFFLLLIWSYRR